MRRHNWIPRPVKERELSLKHNGSAPQQERGPCTQRQRAQTSSRRNHQVTLGTSIHRPPGLPLQMMQQHAVRWGLPLHPVPNLEECQTTPCTHHGAPTLNRPHCIEAQFRSCGEQWSHEETSCES